MKSKKVISLVLILLTAFASGCAGTKSDAGENLKEIRFSLPASPSTMDPQMVTDAYSAAAIDPYTAELYRYNSEGEIVPDLAESYEMSEDGLNWTFHLADGIKWSNGDPITADDFVFSMQRLADPETGSSAIYFITSYCKIKNVDDVYNGKTHVNQLGVYADDAKTLRFELEEPCPYMLSLVTICPFSPCNREFFYSCGGHYCETDEYVLASGAYKVDRYEPLADQIIYSRNTEYLYNDDVDIDRFSFFTIPNVQQAYMCFDIGQLDIASVGGELLDMIGQDSRLCSVEAGIQYLKFNFRNDAVNNINIRSALIRSIDRQALADNVIRNGSTPMTRIVQEGFYSNETPEEYAEETKYFDGLCGYDPEEALNLWNKGLSELGVSSISLNLAYNSTQTSLVEVLQDQWQRTLPGLKITFTPMTTEQWLVALDGGDFDMIVCGWAPDYTDPTAYLYTHETDIAATSPLFSDPNYDGLLEQSRSPEAAGDTEARNKILHQAERYLAEQAAYIPLVFKGSSLMVDDNVLNFAVAPTGVTYVIQDMRLEETT